VKGNRAALRFGERLQRMALSLAEGELRRLDLRRASAMQPLCQRGTRTSAVARLAACFNFTASSSASLGAVN
jgi:hypothetical protein